MVKEAEVCEGRGSEEGQGGPGKSKNSEDHMLGLKGHGIWLWTGFYNLQVSLLKMMGLHVTSSGKTHIRRF